MDPTSRPTAKEAGDPVVVVAFCGRTFFPKQKLQTNPTKKGGCPVKLMFGKVTKVILNMMFLII